MTAVSKKLSANLLLLYAGELGSKVLAFFVFLHLPIELGKEAFGDLSFALGFVFVLLLILEAGLGPYGAREAANHPERLPRIAASVIWVRLFLLIPAFTLLLLQAFVLGGDARRGILLLAGVTLFPAPLVMNWAFQARDEIGIVALTAFLRQAVQAAFVFLLVRDADDGHWAPIGDFVGYVVILVVQWRALLRLTGPLPFRAAIADVRDVFRASWALAISAVASVLRWFLPLLALGWFSTSSQVADFDIGHRLAYAAHSFVWLWFFNLLPSLSRAAAAPETGEWKRLLQRSFTLAFWLGLIGAVSVALIAPSLLPAIYTETYSASVTPFQLLLIALFLAFLSGHHRFALIAFRHPKDDFFSNAAGAAVSGLFAMVAIHLGHGATAAALALVLGEATSLLVAALLLKARVGLFPHGLRWPKSSPLTREGN